MNVIKKNDIKIILIILDGWGFSKQNFGNAFKLTKKPFFSYILKNYPNCLCNASGLYVGLPKNNSGNSEVGHMVIGSGRKIVHPLTYINEEINNGMFFKNPCLNKILYDVYKSNTSLHLMGLFSNGYVHSSLTHLEAILKQCKKYDLKNVFIHAFLDGRDTQRNSGILYLKKFIKFLKAIKLGKIVTLIGRYYAMDRNEVWSRTKDTYETLTKKSININTIYTKNLLSSLSQQYMYGLSDEYISPIILVDNNGIPLYRIQDFDSVIFFNFRADRAKQLTSCFVDIKFNKFYRNYMKNINFISMTNYDKKFNAKVLYDSYPLTNTIGEVLSNFNLKQLRIAETEKYAHVTYFFNGGIEKSFLNETRIFIKSPFVQTYDLKPEMSANEITNQLIEKINEKKYDFITVNFANMDMIGHTGNLAAALKTISVIDKLLKKIYNVSKSNNYILLITSDHGNIECMLN